MQLGQASFLLFLVALTAPALAADAADDGCVVTTEEVIAGAPVAGVLGIAAPGADQDLPVIYDCRAGQVERLRLRLDPGQSAEARLLVATDGLPALGAVATADLPDDWIDLSWRPLDDQHIVVTLRLAVPESATAGRRYAKRLRLAADGDKQGGIEVAVQLEIVAHGSLFRDQFDEFNVDPAIGQFSLVM